MSPDYWLGVATLPLVAAAAFVAFVAWVCAIEALDARFGISFEAKLRDFSNISDYTLRRDIWWERSFGPVFVGGWYRENPKYDAPSHAFATRWIGLGSPNGACVMAFRKQDLGPVARVHANPDQPNNPDAAGANKDGAM